MPDGLRSAIDLWWLPLGAGGHVVRWNGRLYEAAAARRSHRPRQSLFHSALLVTDAGSTYSIEMGPVWNVTAPDRGVVCEGPVGSRHLGRLRWFRYEVRCWRDGVIPDLAEAVDSPVLLSDDPPQVADLLACVPRVPALTWGRDEQHTGEMWNSNSVVAWLLATSGLDLAQVRPPAGGRAPGWAAGRALAERTAAIR